MKIKKQKKTMRRFYIAVLQEIAKMSFWNRIKFCFGSGRYRESKMYELTAVMVKKQAIMNYSEIEARYKNKQKIQRNRGTIPQGVN